MLKSYWVGGGGGLQDLIVSPSPLLGFLGFGDFGVWGLGLDNWIKRYVDG